MTKKIMRKFLTALLAASVTFSNSAVIMPAVTANAASVSTKKIKISPKSKQTIAIGETIKLKAQRSPLKSKGTIVWSSSNTRIASVSQKGKVKGKKTGTVTITAKIKGKNIKASRKIKVAKPAKRVKLEKELNLSRGASTFVKTTFSPKGTRSVLKWKSSNPQIATVNTKGKVKAVGLGTATITATIKGKKKIKAFCKVNVSMPTSGGNNTPGQTVVNPNPVKAVELNATVQKTDMIAGEKMQINTSVLPANTSVKNLKFTSSDPYAAEVSATGMITALAQGFTTITIETLDGSNLKKTIDLTVDYDRANVKKLRTIVTTDMEVDDWNSLIRFFYYLNEFDLTALVQTASMHHWEGRADAPEARYQKPYRWPGTEQIGELIDAYEKIYPNLRSHDPNYPTPNYLRSIWKVGNIGYMGEMSGPTDGSNLIKDILLDDYEGPLYIQHWGGHNTTAMALKQIEDEYSGTPEWDAIKKKVSDKIIMTCYDLQDPVYASYIEPHWPGLLNLDVGGAYDYRTTGLLSPEDDKYLRASWLRRNLVSNHGPLLSKYATYVDGTDCSYDELFRPTMDQLTMEGRNERANRYDFMSEGDSLCFLFLIDRGLRSTEDYTYGGWSGRLVKTDKTVSGVKLTNHWTYNEEYARDNYPHVNDLPESARLDARHSSNMWVADTMRDFAMRADWGVTPKYEDANHLPELSVKVSDDTLTAEETYNITATPGEEITMKAETSDPDGDYVDVTWFNYLEAGTYRPDFDSSIYRIELTGDDSPRMSFTVPEDAQNGETIHIIAKATDDGANNPSVYKRIVIEVQGYEKASSVEAVVPQSIADNGNKMLVSARSETLQAVITPDNLNKSVHWTSSDEDVATIQRQVNWMGQTVSYKLAPVGEGEVTITATAKDGTGLSDSFTIEVVDSLDTAN